MKKKNYNMDEVQHLCLDNLGYELIFAASKEECQALPLPKENRGKSIATCDICLRTRETLEEQTVRWVFGHGRRGGEAKQDDQFADPCHWVELMGWSSLVIFFGRKKARS